MCLNLQREVYPGILLFPAERKNNTVFFEGDIAVSEIIKFLAAHGSDVVDLIMNKGKCCKVVVICLFFVPYKDDMDVFTLYNYNLLSDTFGMILISLYCEVLIFS